jgi:hypothetical protein
MPLTAYFTNQLVSFTKFSWQSDVVQFLLSQLHWLHTVSRTHVNDDVLQNGSEGSIMAYKIFLGNPFVSFG